jgi:hypothetical protein
MVMGNIEPFVFSMRLERFERSLETTGFILSRGMDNALDDIGQSVVIEIDQEGVDCPGMKEQ